MRRPEGPARPNPTARSRPSDALSGSEPSSGATPRPEPAAPARSKKETPSGVTRRPRTEAPPPSGETPRPGRQGGSLSPTAPVRPVGSPASTLAPATSRLAEPAAGSLAPPTGAPVRVFEPAPPPEPPPPPREVQLARPLLALATCALLLVYSGWAAFIEPPLVQQVATQVRPHPVLISGSLPELPPQATVIFSFPDVSVAIEKPLSELHPSSDGRFSINLEVASAQSPQTFEIRTRCPGQPDMRSSSLSLSLSGEAELSGRLTGELKPEKKQL